MFVAILSARVLVTEESQAGNLDAFYLSGEGAMIGGAVVSTTSGGGSIWYNPAGLSELSGTRLDVNVSGYAIRFGTTANFDSEIPGATETRLTPFDIDVVPAAITLTRKFGDVGVGIGVFVPTQSEVILRTSLSAPADENGTSLEFGYDSKSSFQEYHLGPGVGFSPTKKLNLGVSLLANYRDQQEEVDLSASVTSDTSTEALSTHHTLDSVGVGLEMIFGGQYEMTETWTLGAVVRTPAVRLGQATDRVDTYLLASSGGSISSEIDFQEELGISTALLSPFRFHLGTAHDFSREKGSGKLIGSLEGSVTLPLENEFRSLGQRSTWNARAGLSGVLSETWSLGGGIYSDRSPSVDPVRFQDEQVDYYGFTLAVDYRSPYGISSRKEEVFDEPRSLIFGTTIAFSYAIGLGELASARVGPGLGGGVTITPITADVVSHEFSLHISSAISE